MPYEKVFEILLASQQKPYIVGKYRYAADLMNLEFYTGIVLWSFQKTQRILFPLYSQL